MIPYGHQSIAADDIEAVVDVLRGEWITQGHHVDEFEEALASFVGARFAVAFSSGTAALHAAVAVADLGPGDLVATSALSFVASANCARYVGATPCLIDIDPSTLNLDPRLLPPEAVAIVAVHYAGLPLDLSLLPYRPRVVIEDAAHALGAQTPDGPVGNCAHSEMCVFSFHPVKTITTGEGGAVTTNSGIFADALRRFRSHGIVGKPEHGGWYYEVQSLGFNYRMTDIQAALGTSQLGKAQEFVDRRAELQRRYRRRLGDLPVQLPPEPPAGFASAHHLFPVRLADRRRIYEALRAAGIGVQVHYVPIYRHPIYQTKAHTPAQFPHTEAAYERLLSLPLYPDLSDNDQDRVIDVVSSLVCEASS